jgi:hypothetical protein
MLQPRHVRTARHDNLLHLPNPRCLPRHLHLPLYTVEMSHKGAYSKALVKPRSVGLCIIAEVSKKARGVCAIRPIVAGITRKRAVLGSASPGILKPTDAVPELVDIDRREEWNRPGIKQRGRIICHLGAIGEKITVWIRGQPVNRIFVGSRKKSDILAWRDNSVLGRRLTKLVAASQARWRHALRPQVRCETLGGDEHRLGSPAAAGVITRTDPSVVVELRNLIVGAVRPSSV